MTRVSGTWQSYFVIVFLHFNASKSVELSMNNENRDSQASTGLLCSHVVSVVRELLQKQKKNDRLMGEDSSTQNFFEENVSSEIPSILKKCH